MEWVKWHVDVITLFTNFLYIHMCVTLYPFAYTPTYFGTNSVSSPGSQIWCYWLEYIQGLWRLVIVSDWCACM